MGIRAMLVLWLWWSARLALAATVPVPEALEPWREWALFGAEGAGCPFHIHSFAQRACVWPGPLTLSVTADGLRFTQDVEVHGRSPGDEAAIELPGSDGFWPVAVSTAGTALTVVAEDGHPVVHLEPGRHRIDGLIPWYSLPDSLRIPPHTALVHLRQADGRAVAPRIDADGRLWLVEHGQGEPAPVETAENHLHMEVFRHLLDDIPFRMETRLQFQVSGSPREVVLGRALPDGFVAQRLDSPLPARLEADGRLRVQVRPGLWTLQLTARRTDPVTVITLVDSASSDGAAKPAADHTAAAVFSTVKATAAESTAAASNLLSDSSASPEAFDSAWPAEEIWVVEAQPALRQIRVEGVAAVDPRQTTLPPEWQALPAYRLQPGDSLTLRELRRGDPQPSPNQIELERHLWLDFSGAGFTVRDRFSGHLYRDWRLDAGPHLQPGSLDIDGVPQVITRLADGRQGVEIRNGELRVSALGRTGEDGATHRRTLAASGWLQDVDRLQATLQLPPGWRVFTATGVDRATGTWTATWSVWDLFLVLIAVVAAARLRGLPTGLLTAAALILIHPEHPTALYLLLNVLGVTALLAVLPAGRLGSLLRWYGHGAILVLLLSLLGFMVEQARLALYPQLQMAWKQIGEDDGEYRRDGYGGSSEYPAGDIAAAYPSSDEMEGGLPASAPMEAELAMAIDSAQNATLGRLAKSAPAPEGSFSEGYAPGRPSPRPKADLQRMDPDLAAQTGPGQAHWTWLATHLTWSGPVTRDETFSLWLLTPLENRLLAWLRVILSVLLLAGVTGVTRSGGRWRLADPRMAAPRKDSPRMAAARTTAAGDAAGNAAPVSRGGHGSGVGPRGAPGSGKTLAVLLALLFAPAAQAGLPDADLLETLRERLLGASDCTPSCFAIERSHLTLQGERLTVRFTVHARESVYWPLPDSQRQWHIDSVLLDGQPHGLRNQQPGQVGLEVAVGAGRHDLLLSGTVAPGRDFQLGFPLPIHNLAVEAPQWRVSGIDNGRLPSSSLHFSPLDPVVMDAGATGGTLTPDPVVPFVTVRRELHLGLNWVLDTSIERVAPLEGGISLELPLLSGESITTPGIDVKDGKARVRLGPEQQGLTWSSTVERAASLTLSADTSGAWSEHWSVDPSPLWHLTSTGIAPLKEATAVTQWRPQWRPYPGETLRLDIERPAAVAGPTTTIEQVRQTWTPGLREASSELRLHVISSKGGEQRIELPAGARVKAVRVNDEDRAAAEDEPRVVVALNPGRHWIEVAWNEASQAATLARTPALSITAPYVNHSLQVQMPEDRWVLFAGGPGTGPAILFWGATCVALLLAVALGQSGASPLRTVDWMLLVLGLCTGWLTAIMVVALWFFAMHQRGTRPTAHYRRWQFNLLQWLLAIFTLVVVAVLLAAIPHGLLGTPDMGITGNGSSQHLLNWFVDRGDATLASAWVVSVPLWTYRALMLLWSLWLALQLPKWLRWGWQAFARDGYWRGKTVIT